MSDPTKPRRRRGRGSKRRRNAKRAWFIRRIKEGRRRRR